MHVIARLCIDKVWRCEAPECGWASPPGAHRKTAYHHLDSAHPDMKPHTLSKRDVGQGVLSEEERAARRREQRRRSEAKRRAERRSKRGAGPRVRIDGTDVNELAKDGRMQSTTSGITSCTTHVAAMGRSGRWYREAAPAAQLRVLPLRRGVARPHHREDDRGQAGGAARGARRSGCLCRGGWGQVGGPLLRRPMVASMRESVRAQWPSLLRWWRAGAAAAAAAAPACRRVLDHQPSCSPCPPLAHPTCHHLCGA